MHIEGDVKTEWLVEVKVMAGKSQAGKIVSYEEVLASNIYEARREALHQFCNRCKYEPIMRRRMEVWKLTTHDCIAQEAIELTP